MHYIKNSKMMAIFLTTILSSNLIGANFSSTVRGQSNDTSQGNGTDYTGFHSNIEQINGHIDQAVYNKHLNNQTLTVAHTLHPIEEVLSLITIPLSQSDSNLNQTYFENLNQLSKLASENSTVANFEKQANSSLQLSNEVVETVVPANVLHSIDHNASVIKDLLTVAGSEYAEGVAEGKIVLIIECQDGSAFIESFFIV